MLLKAAYPAVVEIHHARLKGTGNLVDGRPFGFAINQSKSLSDNDLDEFGGAVTVWL